MNTLTPLLHLALLLLLWIAFMLFAGYCMAKIIGQERRYTLWLKKKWKGIQKKHGKMMFGIVIGILLVWLFTQPTPVQQ